MDYSKESDDRIMDLILRSIEKLDPEEMEKVIDAFPQKIPEFISEASQILLKEIISIGAETLDENRKVISDYVSKSYTLWKNPLDYLELYIWLVFELGEKYNRLYQKSAIEKNDLTFDVLIRLHARGCQIANEILVLLKNGYPDGAHARWRTLHEIAVTSMFISMHGNDVAEAYLYYDYIECYKAARMHRDCYKGTGEEPLSDDEIARLKKFRDDLCKADRFGPRFDQPYGWALKALGMDGANFSVLEKSVALGHLRPYYKFASSNVHSDPHGIMYRLAQGRTENKPLIVGASYLGLADAGHSTAISLLQIINSLLFSTTTVGKITLENCVNFNMLSLMEKKIGEAFIEVHNLTKNKPQMTKLFNSVDKN